MQQRIVLQAAVPEGMPQRIAPQAAVREGTPQRIVLQAAVREGTPQRIAPQAIVPEGTPQRIVLQAIVPEGTPQRVALRVIAAATGSRGHRPPAHARLVAGIVAGQRRWQAIAAEAMADAEVEAADIRNCGRVPILKVG